jgi:hypothetical protein
MGATAGRALAWLVATIVGGGGSVVLPENDALLSSADFLGELGLHPRPAASLGFAHVFHRPGFYVMAAPTGHAVELLTGLGATGVQLLLAHVDGPPLQGHPLISTLQIATSEDAPPAGGSRFAADLDYLLPAAGGDPAAVCQALLRLLRESAQGNYRPPLWRAGNTDFQVTRGRLGVSL